MKVLRFLSCLCVILGLPVFLTGCPNSAHEAKPENEPKGMMYFSYFDTVSYIHSYAGDSQEEFEAKCNEVAAILGEYHRLFDIYYEHSGVNNLRTINLNAGKDPVQVDQKLIDFLLYAKELYHTTDGEMNIMMGSVLRLWHDCRTAASTNPAKAKIPEMSAVEEAALHTDFSCLEIDEANQTVRITDP